MTPRVRMNSWPESAGEFIRIPIRISRRMLTVPALLIYRYVPTSVAIFRHFCHTLSSVIQNFIRGWSALIRVTRQAAAWLEIHAAQLCMFAPLLLRRPKPLEPTLMPRSQREIVMLVISELWHDPRVEREARALAQAGYKVKVIYPDFFSKLYNIQPLDWGPNIDFRPLPGEYHRFMLEFPWLLGNGMLKAALDERPFAFHCHDLTVSLVGLAAANATGAYCVCDFHEWYSENVSWSTRVNAWVPHPRFKRRIYKLAEWWLMCRATALITVCDSIAQDLQDERPATRRKLAVIRNIPSFAASHQGHRNLRDELMIAADTFVVLWQGGVGPSRLLEPVIEAMAHVPRGVLVIRGPAIEQFGDAYAKLASERGCAERVRCLAPVPSSEVVAAAAAADAGLWTLPNLCKNFRYALPNKIFEYLAAGLPILCGDYPEARRIAVGYEVGLCFDPYDPRSIAKQINRLIDEPELAGRFRANTTKALADMQAPREWSKVVELYDGLAAGRSVEGDHSR